MVKRSRLEIFFDVLKVIESGEDKPTRIMYGTNLSWIVLHHVIDTLRKRGFIEVEKRGRSNRYYISDKGRNSLSYYEKSKEGLTVIEVNGEGST